MGEWQRFLLVMEEDAGRQSSNGQWKSSGGKGMRQRHRLVVHRWECGEGSVCFQFFKLK